MLKESVKHGSKEGNGRCISGMVILDFFFGLTKIVTYNAIIAVKK
jgi:hypothetical protein